MKTAVPAAFYDALLDNPVNPFLGAVEASPYLEMYRRVVPLVPVGSSVVELGCGVGHLASLLLASGRMIGYLGIDFSPRLLALARETVAEGAFLLADLRTAPIPKVDCYIATEVLEHLDDDRRLVGALPPGSTVILTVPSFDSESHVRVFPNRGDARRRYQDLLAIDHESYVERPRPGAFFHVLRGVRR